MRYAHIGWCQEGTHDKVWGVICLEETVRPCLTDWDIEEEKSTPGKYLVFWGRRGKKLQTKLAHHHRLWLDDAVEEMFFFKLKKGYKQIDKSKLDTVYPEFEQDLEKTAIWAILRS
jgi:hypothetical protein